MKYIPKAEQPGGTWSGGTTRQVWIFPEGSSYTDRNFKIRISTATVDVEESNFTSLPGYFRTLMVLEGELKTVHKNQHIARLKKFETDQFLGEWETKGYGRCTDFNIICTGQYDVLVEDIGPDAGEWFLDFESTFHKVGFYIHKGGAELYSTTSKVQLHQGDFILLEGEECNGMFTLQHHEGAEIIFVIVQ